MTKECTAACPTGAVPDSGYTCKTCAVATNDASPYLKENECVAKCEGENYDFNDNGVCKASCSRDLCKVDTNSQKVPMTKCEGEGYEYNDNKVCKDKCASGFYTTDESDNKICSPVCGTT